MASASPSPTPNPNAMKFTLDTTLAEMMDVHSAVDASTDFQRAIFAIPGVVSLFGVNDFVTITRDPSAEWDSIVTGVVEAAAAHL
jgi:hypothetical protein